MARIVLLTGGGRSGKSGYAQAQAEAQAGPRVYIATCPVLDDEMRERIRKHREMRAPADWETLEEPVDLAGALRRTATAPVHLIDCLTLWLNNLLYQAELQGGRVTEADVAARCRELLSAGRELPGTLYIVTNEVGLGIIPENALARLFRDLAGRANQVVAAGADEVIFMVSGLPLVLKR